MVASAEAIGMTQLVREECHIGMTTRAPDIMLAPRLIMLICLHYVDMSTI